MWSPDGQRIVFAAWFDAPKGNDQIVTLDPVTGQMTQLTYEGDNIEPYWVPD
jgi:Tol biopolymer transport system component